MSIKKILTFFGWPLLVLPIVAVYFGFALNELCIIPNGGFMPVRQDNCEKNWIKPPAAKQDELDQLLQHMLGGSLKVQDERIDQVHSCMTPGTRRKWLADIFPTDAGIESIGDQFIEFGNATQLYGQGIWVLYFLYAWHRKEKFYWE